MSMSRDWDRLARAVDDARYVCGLDTLAAFVRATGITEKTARKLLAAEPVAPKTRRMVERALGWPSRAIDEILAGRPIATATREQPHESDRRTDALRVTAYEVFSDDPETLREALAIIDDLEARSRARQAQSAERPSGGEVKEQ